MKRMVRRRSKPAIGPQQDRGFTLIEVLIALAVLAFGLLGAALMQTLNLRYTQSANQRSQAVNLGNELTDMVRANRTEISAYTAIDAASFSSVTVPSNGCTAPTSLTSANNIARWKCELIEHLGADATAVVTIPANGQLSVQINWIDANVAALTGAGTITLVTRL